MNPMLMACWIFMASSPWQQEPCWKPVNALSGCAQEGRKTIFLFPCNFRFWKPSLFPGVTTISWLMVIPFGQGLSLTRSVSGLPTGCTALIRWKQFSIETADLHRVPASEVLHLYEPLRPGQLRGQPLLASVLLRMFHLDKFDDATLLRQEIANLFTGFITKPHPEQERVDPLTGKTIQTNFENIPMVTMEPGTIQELAPGEEVNFNTPPGSATGYPDFMRQQLMASAAGMGLPFELLSGDMKGVSDRALRVVLNEFRRRIQQIQHNQIVFQLCRPVWNRWLDLAVLSGAISAPNLRDPKEQIPSGEMDSPWAGPTFIRCRICKHRNWR